MIILGMIITVTVTLCESKKSGFLSESKSKSYRERGIFQNCLSASTLQINFDVGLMSNVSKTFLVGNTEHLHFQPFAQKLL